MPKTVQQRRTTHPPRDAFTLLDVVITLLIIGILAVVAAPRFTSALYRNRADAVARRVQADLEWARRHAVSSSAPVTLTFSPGTDSYAIPALVDLDNPNQSYSVDLTAYPYNGKLVSAVFDGDAVLQFDRFGQPDSSGTIVVESGGYQRTVTVNAITGGAVVQ